MIVVSDTSPITNLIVVGKAEILSSLFTSVHVPPCVYHELVEHHPKLPDFIIVSEISNPELSQKLEADLDPGESEAIALALELKPDYLLIDEKLGRNVAEGLVSR